MTPTPGMTPGTTTEMRNEVRVCRIPLLTPPRDLNALRALLSEPEQERADRFLHPAKRHEFILCRARLRQQLGTLLNIPPQSVALTYGPNGKPDLINADWHFNVSHTQGMALIALAYQRRVGIDIEALRPRESLDQIATRFFAPDEASRIGALPPEQRARAFFAVWTRKEAILKALGGGITLGLDRYVVTVDPDTPPRLLASPDPATQWTLVDLTVSPTHAAALAIQGPPPTITLLDL